MRLRGDIDMWRPTVYFCVLARFPRYLFGEESFSKNGRPPKAYKAGSHILQPSAETLEREKKRQRAKKEEAAAAERAGKNSPDDSPYALESV